MQNIPDVCPPVTDFISARITLVDVIKSGDPVIVTVVVLLPLPINDDS